MAAPPDGYDELDIERFDAATSDDDDPRPPFARDYDRLIYSTAFRRLQGKTQVVSPGEADFFRTRLTHTIEVAQVARRLAEHLNRSARRRRQERHRPPDWLPRPRDWADMDPAEHMVDADLCEAAAILHDLGHPPFGHAGEEALHDAVRALTGEAQAPAGWTLGRWEGASPSGFNGNAQSFRLAVHTLRHKGRSGLQLTRATLDACLKYPWEYGSAASVDSTSKWNIDPVQREMFASLRAGLPDSLRHVQTIEAQIMDWADDIAYSMHDVDDWSRAGYMPLSDLVNDQKTLHEFARGVVDSWLGRKRITPAQSDDALERIVGLFSAREGPFMGFLRDLPGGIEAMDPSSDESHQAIAVARGQLFNEFLYKPKLAWRGEIDPDLPRRYQLVLEIPERTRWRNQALKELLWRYVVSDLRMATQQHGQQHVVTQLFTAYVRAAMTEKSSRMAIFPSADRSILLSTTSSDHALRAVVDYVSGMTDAYAAGRHERLLAGTARLHEYA